MAESKPPAKAAITRSPADQAWFVTFRWQQFRGEARANQLRLLSIGAFYLTHLWQYYGSQGDDARFHLLISLLALGWCTVAAAVHFSLRARFFPAWLPFVSTLADVVFLSLTMCVSVGTRSPLIMAYPLIIAMTSLRFDLRLVRVATVASLVGYLCVAGCSKWPETFGLSAEVERTVPRQFQLMTLVGIGLSGLIIGQAVRSARSAAVEFAGRLEPTDETADNQREVAS